MSIVLCILVIGIRPSIRVGTCQVPAAALAQSLITFLFFELQFEFFLSWIEPFDLIVISDCVCVRAISDRSNLEDPLTANSVETHRKPPTCRVGQQRWVGRK